ncbi:MAG: protein kinase [Planctomycetes bacterium]|nr:protein kinase [Planctomycetota bacterium]
MGSKHKRKESISARLALLKPEGETTIRRELGEERWVQDEKRGERVAMLRLHEGALPNSKIRRSFDRQVKAVAGFEHPGVVSVLEGGTNDGEGRGFLISASVEGATLREYMAEKGPLDPSDAIAIAVDLLNALAAGHHRWLVHGGISPDSVLIVPVDGRPEARILHYGFTPVVGEAQTTSFGEARVALDYAAPESVKGEPVDPRADVYSVGVLLFEMVTGRHPVPATGSDPVRSRVLDQADVLPGSAVEDAEVGGLLKSVLQRALEKNPAERFCSARSFALALAGQPLNSEDPFEDPWAWPEACPEGGTCSASGVTIPAYEDRSWSRKQSDRPFRCRVSGKDFAGGEQWDSRGLCSRGGRHKPLPDASGDAPEDVIYDDLLDTEDEAPASETQESSVTSEEAPAQVEPGAPEEAAAAEAPEAPDASPAEDSDPRGTEKLDRRAALRALLRDDARMAGLLGPEDEADELLKTPAAADPAEEPVVDPVEEPSPALVNDDRSLVLDEVVSRDRRERSSSGRDLSESTTLKVEEAFLDAWDDARRQTEAATTRMKRANSRAIGRPLAAAPGALGEEQPKTATRSVGRPKTTAPATSRAEPFWWQVAAVVLGVILLVLGNQLDTATKTSAAHTQTIQGVRGKLAQAQVDNAQTHKRLTEAKDQLRNTKGALRSREGKLAKSRGELQQRDARLVRAGKRLAATQETLAATRETLAATQETLVTRASELLAEKEAGLKVTKQLASEQRVRVATEAEGERLRGELQTKTASIRDLSADLLKSKSETVAERGALRGAREQLAQSRERVLQTKSALSLAQAEGLAAAQDRDSTRTALAESKRLGKTQRAALASLRGKADSLATSLARLEREREALRAKVAASDLALRALKSERDKLRTQVAASGLALGALKRERSDLLVDLADLEAEREQLDAEGLQLERWLREAEASRRELKKAARSGESLALRLRAVAPNGQAKDATALSLSLGERGLAVVESAAIAPWLVKAQQGEVLMTLRVRCQGGPPVLKLQGFLAADRVERPTGGGVVLRLERVAPNEYRAWLTKALLARHKAQTGNTGFGLLLVGGSNLAQVTGVELRVSHLSEDARGLLERER